MKRGQISLIFLIAILALIIIFSIFIGATKKMEQIPKKFEGITSDKTNIWNLTVKSFDNTNIKGVKGEGADINQVDHYG